MPQWVYKATPALASYEDTLDLAKRNNFLCRSAFGRAKDGGPGSPAKLVAEVAVGDLIHFYFSHGNGRINTLGSFEVHTPDRYPGSFEALPDFGALVAVIESPENARFIERLGRGYEPDPKLDRFTGWPIERIAGADTPKFEQQLFPSAQSGLCPYPAPPKKARP